MTDSTTPPAYGGPGWTPRSTRLKEELGSLWGACGLDSEWRPLKAVLLHRPGRELEEAVRDPRASLLLADLDPALATIQHDALAQAYRDAGVFVRYVEPPTTPPPNQMFMADLMAMTPEGAILARPASSVRAGEERWAARALAELGVPILRAVRGEGTFEGADLMWISPGRALLATGLRTNRAGADQVASLLEEMGVEVTHTHLPPGTMHLMGQLRIVDADLALFWPGRLPEDAVAALGAEGFQAEPVPDEVEAREGFALNVVVLGPRALLMPAGNPLTRTFYEGLGIDCTEVEMGELAKAAGAMGCLTGILERESEGPSGPA